MCGFWLGKVGMRGRRGFLVVVYRIVWGKVLGEGWLRVKKEWSLGGI